MEDPSALLGCTAAEVEALLGLPAGALLVETLDGRTDGEASEAGVSVVFRPDGRTRTVHLHAPGYEGYSGFPGPLPDGLSYELDRAAARRLLGEPETGRDAQVLGGKEVGGWDRWRLHTHQLHLAYSIDGTGIDLVTLMELDLVPGQS